MSKKLLEKIKANRTRPAEIEGEPVKVRVHSGAELKKILDKVKGGEDKIVAAVLAEQFLGQDGEPIFTAEWFLTEDCPQVFFTELAQIFIEVNSGLGKKKTELQTA